MGPGVMRQIRIILDKQVVDRQGDVRGRLGNGRRHRGLLYCEALILILLFAGCALSVDTRYPFDFSRFHDGPLPEDVKPYLEGGPQSLITPKVSALAERITGANRRERLFKAMRFVWGYFSYDSWLNSLKCKRTAEELYESRVLGGCSDYALAECTLFRAVGIPARLVVTANVDWIHQYRQDDLAMAEGHCFVEVYLEDRWHLVDSTYRWLFSGYKPGGAVWFPHGECFCRRGKDFWDMGIRDGDDLSRVLVHRALNYEGHFEEPAYKKSPI